MVESGKGRRVYSPGANGKKTIHDERVFSARRAFYLSVVNDFKEKQAQSAVHRWCHEVWRRGFLKSTFYLSNTMMNVQKIGASKAGPSGASASSGVEGQHLPTSTVWLVSICRWVRVSIYLNAHLSNLVSVARVYYDDVSGAQLQRFVTRDYDDDCGARRRRLWRTTTTVLWRAATTIVVRGYDDCGARLRRSWSARPRPDVCRVATAICSACDPAEQTMGLSQLFVLKSRRTTRVRLSAGTCGYVQWRAATCSDACLCAVENHLLVA